MLKRILMVVIPLLALLVLAPLAAFWFFTSTASGLGVLARQLDRLNRFGIHTEGVTGTLAGPLYIKRIEIDLDAAHILIEDVTASLDRSALLWQTIAVSDLSIRNVQVQLKQAPDKPPDETAPKFLPSFLRIAVDRVAIAHAQLALVGGQRYDSSHVQASLRLTSGEMSINDIDVVTPQIGVAGVLQMKAARPLGLTMALAAKMKSPRNELLSLSARTRGDLENLQITLRMMSPSVANVDATVKRKEDAWSIDGTADSPDFSLSPWMENPPLSFREAAFGFSAGDRGNTIHGEVLIPQLSTLPITLDAAGRFAQRVLEIQSAKAAIKTTASELNAAGTVKLLDAGPELNLTAQWKSLQWPLVGARALLRSDGSMRLTGSEDFNFTIDTNLTSDRKELRIRAARGELTGSLSKTRLLLQRYSVDTLGGKLQGDGQLVFQAPRDWRLRLNATNLDPKLVHAQFPGWVAFSLAAQGRGVDSKALFKAQLQQLNGTLRNQKLTGHGAFEHTATGWKFDDVALGLGTARLQTNGRWEDTLDVKVNFVADSLQDLLPEMSGRVRFEGHATGKPDAPALTATLNATEFSYRDLKAATIAGSADVHLGSANQHSHFQVTAQRPGKADLVLQSMQISGDGTAAQHELQLTASALPRSGGYVPWSGKLVVAGKYDKRSWSGALNTAELGRNYGWQKIVLQHPAPLYVSADRMSLESACLEFAEKPVCLQGSWTRQGQWSLRAEGDDIALGAFNSDNQDDAHFTGTWALHLNASAEPGKPWTADGRLAVKDATAAYKPLMAEVETFTIGTGEVALHAVAQEITSALKLKSTDTTWIDASAHLNRKTTEDLMRMPLQAQLQAHTDQIQLLPVLIADVDRATGIMDADMRVTGTLAEPELGGSIKLHDGELDLYRINLALRAVQLTVQLASNQLKFDGQGRLGDGTLGIGGTLAWLDKAPRGTLTVKGDNLLVADLPEYRVVASPNLKFDVSGRKIDASGEIEIPSARIQPVDLRGAKQISSDARMINEAPTDANSAFVVRSEVKVAMGKDVQINAFGLQGKLGGSVSTITGGTTAMGRGELSVGDGKYEAYGQKLDITRGRLLFDASPLDDPGLDIAAERKMEAQNIKVGLNVRGTLHAPRVSFYSDPSMSQTRILSYLLVGKSIDDAQTTTAGGPSTSSSLALQGGGFLASKLGERIGLQQVGIESDSTNNTALVLGKFLSPRLFVSYGISLTEAINTLKLRYTINDHWTVKTEHGEHQSADLEYTIEKE